MDTIFGYCPTTLRNAETSFENENFARNKFKYSSRLKKMFLDYSKVSARVFGGVFCENTSNICLERITTSIFSPTFHLL